jgi:hypothetical protein
MAAFHRRALAAQANQDCRSRRRPLRRGRTVTPAVRSAFSTLSALTLNVPASRDLTRGIGSAAEAISRPRTCGVPM